MNVMIPINPDRQTLQYMLEEAPSACAYWMDTVKVQVEDETWQQVVVREIEEHAWPGQPAVYGEEKTLTTGTLVTGMIRMMDPDFRVNGTIRGTVAGLLLGPPSSDACDWDAETTDCVVQAYMFNELRYG